MGIANAAAAAMDPLHPYHPLGVAIPGYVANEMATVTILAYFAVGCSLVLGATAVVVLKYAVPRYAAGEQGRGGRRISTGEVATAMWFVLCGFIHIGMEGEFLG